MSPGSLFALAILKFPSGLSLVRFFILFAASEAVFVHCADKMESHGAVLLHHGDRPVVAVHDDQSATSTFSLPRNTQATLRMTTDGPLLVSDHRHDVASRQRRTQP